MSRPNICIKDASGQDQWISRSVVVIPVVFRMDETTGDIYTLVEKRGPAVSHTGEWCCPCGYLDWDETLIDACVREVREETGIDLDENKILFTGIDTNVQSLNQTVDLWYMCWTDEPDIDKTEIETLDEIMDVKWLKVGRIHYRMGLFKTLTIYKKSIDECYGKWAFKEHKYRISGMLKMMVKGKIIEVNE